MNYCTTRSWVNVRSMSKKNVRPIKNIKPEQSKDDKSSKSLPEEIGGRKGPEPSRYGDWEKGGRAIDF